MAESTVLRRRPWAIGSAVLGLGMLAIYVAVIVAQGGNSFFDILPWALLMAIAVAIAFAGALTEERHIARNLLIGAGALYGVLGVVSLLTIGIGFLLAAAAAAVGASRV